MKAGILDFLDAGFSGAIDGARVAERCGYSRYWVAEHPPQANPIVAVASIAATTSHIRVGTGGISLLVHTAIRSAHDFGELAALHRGRIDAGFCAGGIPPDFWDDYRFPKHFDPKRGYRSWVERLTAAAHEVEQRPPPSGEKPWCAPQYWCLGSSPRSAALAREMGLAFSYSMMHRGSTRDPQVLQDSENTELEAGRKTHSRSLTLAVVCDTKQEIREMQCRHLEASSISPTAVGDPAACADIIRAESQRFGVDEVMLHLPGLPPERHTGTITNLARELL